MLASLRDFHEQSVPTGAARCMPLIQSVWDDANLHCHASGKPMRQWRDSCTATVTVITFECVCDVGPEVRRPTPLRIRSSTCGSGFVSCWLTALRCATVMTSTMCSPSGRPTWPKARGASILRRGALRPDGRFSNEKERGQERGGYMPNRGCREARSTTRTVPVLRGLTTSCAPWTSAPA